MDWFDIQTKSRALIADLLQPTITKLTMQRDELNQHSRTITVLQGQVKDLEYTVFKKNQRLTIFEEIDEKILENEKNRVESEASLQYQIDSIAKQREDFMFEVDTLKRRADSLE